ncbi:universal stress protein [Bizionia gelidisalsuginis]|uniref:Universal stress protein n=2 Tax=Bizionia TaxID=283785 RepID=A0A8H2LC50_9FLAO|nr:MULTISPECIES: universal stress protein [Bizionia]TYB72552.1 universal stress protein [Bizionia saleffrena]TYC09172.1 universal stress protein [Bizionia gelidisalsuginis]
MRHHILLPTDFSKNALSAALYAIRLYNSEPCTFYFLHAWSFSNSSTRTYISSEYIDKLEEKAQYQLLGLKTQAEADKTNALHKFEIFYSKDPLVKSIEVAIETHSIDLVVMGTNGASGTNRFLFGSNAVSIITKMKLCPILVVPADFDYIEPKHIGFPTDFKHLYSSELLSLKHFSKLCNSEVKVVHFNESDDLSHRQNTHLVLLKESLEGYKHSFHWMTDNNTKELAIKEFIRAQDINVLAMINYKHSFIESITKEPIVKNIGFHPVIPFLVIPCFS